MPMLRSSGSIVRRPSVLVVVAVADGRKLVRGATVRCLYSSKSAAESTWQPPARSPFTNAVGDLRRSRLPLGSIAVRRSCDVEDKNIPVGDFNGMARQTFAGDAQRLIRG